MVRGSRAGPLAGIASLPGRCGGEAGNLVRRRPDSGDELGHLRLVNVGSSSCRVAREYMIRLAPGDLADPDKLGPMAEACGLTPEAFRSRHGYLTED